MKNCIGSHLIPTAFDVTKLKHGNMETKLIFDATRNVLPYLNNQPFPNVARVPKEITDKIKPDEYLKDCTLNFQE